MSLNTNSHTGLKVSKTAPMEPATYPARSVAIVDLGLQPQSAWQGKDKAPVYKIAITYEFVDEFMKDEDGKDIPNKPRWLTEVMAIYNLSAEKAKSTARYKALDPDNKYKGNFSKLVNVPVLVTVVHNPNKKVPGSVWENIGEVSPMRQKDAEKCPKLVNKPLIFDMDTPDLDTFRALPKFIQKLIVSGLEFEGSKLDTLMKEVNYEVVNEEEPVEEAVEVDETKSPY